MVFWDDRNATKSSLNTNAGATYEGKRGQVAKLVFGARAGRGSWRYKDKWGEKWRMGGAAATLSIVTVL